MDPYDNANHFYQKHRENQGYQSFHEMMIFENQLFKANYSLEK